MAQTRREFLRCAAGLGGLLLAGSAKAPAQRPAAMRAAVRYLAARQSPDGAWRSESYAAFRDGDALTPVVLWAMQSSANTPIDAAAERGLGWLERLTDARQQAEAWVGLTYPLFTASYAAQAFARIGDSRRALVWAGLIERLRTSAALGWPANDPACGAWGDASVPPRYSHPVPDMIAPNLSATALAVQALSAAGLHTAAQTALPFIAQCQNFAAVPDEPLDDGGFFFAPDDPIRNKAGGAGRDAAGHERFRSYGSTTCDGYLALGACGMRSDHPRLRSASEWLRRHSAGLSHSGAWPAQRGAARESLVFYHAQALAMALRGLKTDAAWASGCERTLVADLVEQQAPNGSWRGSSPDSCEDEPLLATAFALRALA